jgi:hypothetical protein
MSDHFATEARAFLLQYDRLKLPERSSFQDLPDKSSVRVVMSLAEEMSIQRPNPLRDFNLPELLTIDLADNFLKWCSDPTDPAKWSVLFDLRASLEDVEDDGD